MSSDTDPGRWNGAGNCIDPPLNLIITVIAESLDGDGRNIRFIEICSPDKKDFTSTEDLLLMRYEGTDEDPSTSPLLYLKGHTVNKYGFILFFDTPRTSTWVYVTICLVTTPS